MDGIWMDLSRHGVLAEKQPPHVGRSLLMGSKTRSIAITERKQRISMTKANDDPDLPIDDHETRTRLHHSRLDRSRIKYH